MLNIWINNSEVNYAAGVRGSIQILNPSKKIPVPVVSVVKYSMHKQKSYLPLLLPALVIYLK